LNAPRLRAVATVLGALACAASARAAAPVVDYLYPAGGKQGETVNVTAGGKFEHWPLQFWADHPDVRAEPSAEKGRLTVRVGAGVPPGPHLVRLYDAEGPSAPLVFVVGTRPEVMEAEPNDEVSKAQPIDVLPVTVNGRLEKSGDVDSYAVRLQAGQCLSAAVQGRRLGAPMDPLLHLYDAAGNPLAFAHDGLGLDPLLVFRAESSGTYVVRVEAFKFPPAADVKLAGEAQDVYRLSLTAALPVRYVIPAGVRRGTSANVRLFDWDGHETGTREVEAAAAPTADDLLWLPTDGGDGAIPVALGDGPELLEADASKASTAESVPSVPFAVTGRLAAAGERDSFTFAAKKGERLTASLRATALASPMDPVVRIEDPQGKELSANDDARGQAGDAELEWTAPADGVYRAVVADLFGKGGHEYAYRLAVHTPAPRLVATVAADEFRVTRGKSLTVKLSVVRPAGYACPLAVVATGLPAGVVATAAEVPEKGGEVTLTLAASVDAKPSGGPFKVVVVGTDPTRPAAWPAVFRLKKEAGQELVSETSHLWLTVLPAEAPK
jgi:hypothetical protein